MTTQAGVSEGRLESVGELTAERLAELRRIAEAATPGPWWLDGWDIRSEDGDRFIASITDAFCGQRPDARLEELSANGYHISTFDPPTVLALLDEIERLREMLFRLYQDTVSGAYCHRCSLSAGDHDETCAMAEVEALLGLEFERGVRDE